MLFRKSHIFEQNMTLADIENMLPFEREVYIIQINSKIQEYENNNKGKSNG